MEYSLPYPGLLAALRYFVLLLPTLCCFCLLILPKPVAGRTRLQQAFTQGAHARCQSSSATQGRGRVGYSTQYPHLLQLCAAFAYFVLLLPTFLPIPQPNPSSCSKTAPQVHAHGPGVPLLHKGVAVWNTAPRARPSSSFVQLWDTFAYFVLLLPTFWPIPAAKRTHL